MGELVLACRPTIIELPTEGTGVCVGGNKTNALIDPKFGRDSRIDPHTPQSPVF
jgi:hypothetical protein